MMQFREAEPRDIPELIDIDIKSLDFPWTMEQWRESSQSTVCIIATYYGSIIGFVILNQKVLNVELQKIAVRREFRGRNIGTLLMMQAHYFAEDIGAKEIFIVIPESLCDPNGRNILPFLCKNNFQAKKVVRDKFINCGTPEDGFEFRRVVNA